jgi:hypothetical protein
LVRTKLSERFWSEFRFANSTFVQAVCTGPRRGDMSATRNPGRVAGIWYLLLRGAIESGTQF